MQKKICKRAGGGEAGFTLLEMMISLGIAALIFTVIYGVFNTVHRGNEQMEVDADRYRLARLGFYHLAQDLSMVYVSRGSPGPSGVAIPELTFKGLDSEQLNGNTTFENDSLEFSTVSHQSIGMDVPESDYKKVRYSLQEGYLIQEAWLSNGRAVTNELGGPIEGLSFRYLEKQGEDWLDTWDADEKSQKPPVAVEIEFVLKNQDHEARRFKTWVDIPMALGS